MRGIQAVLTASTIKQNITKKGTSVKRSRKSQLVKHVVLVEDELLRKKE